MRLIYYKNLVFGGGGVLGIAYLGVLQYLYETGIFKNVKRIAGTSAGAITACMASLNMTFEKVKEMADTLDYKKIPGKDLTISSLNISEALSSELENLFGDYNCVIRLLNNYGWFSSNYLYSWLQKQIESQFDTSLKEPPYTFADFKNPDLHKGKRPFLDLYVVGTNVSYRTSQVFCYETSPDLEVAEAVRISMSIPLFFEAVKSEEKDAAADKSDIFCDGGIMWNYPIHIFDSMKFKQYKIPGVNNETLGVRFLGKIRYHKIDNLLSYIKNLYLSQLHVQQDIFKRNPHDVSRTIIIDTADVSSVDFDITVQDETYQYLYRQGYLGALRYFQ